MKPEPSNNSTSATSSARSALSRGTIIIGIVSFLSDISSEMVYPILPSFLSQTLGAPKTAVGLIEGIATGTARLFTVLSGWISDRVGQRKFVAFTGYALTAISRPLISLASAWPVVLGARFADRMGKGIRGAPKDALLADNSTQEERGRAYGFERMMDFSGSVLGPLIGWWLFVALAVEMRSMFIIAAIPAVIATILILTLKEKRDDTASKSKAVKLSFEGTTRQYKLLLLVSAVFSIANSANAFLILRAESLGLTTGQTIIAYMLFNFVAALVAMPAGIASDRFGRRNLLVIGYVVYALTYLGFGAATQSWMVWPLFAAYGFFPALTEGTAKAMVIDTAGEAGRGTALGIYSGIVGLTQIPASLIGGLLWDYVNAKAPFYFGAAVASLAVVMLLLLLPSRQPAHISVEQP
jgi:MFS family permease